MSQERRNLGAIPKTNMKPFQNKRPFIRDQGRSVYSDYFPRQEGSIRHNQESARDGRRYSILGFKRLTQLSESDMDERELSLTLLSSTSGLDELLKQDTIRPDWMKLLLPIFVKACNSTCREYVLPLLNTIAQSKFLEHHITTRYLSNIRHIDPKEQMHFMHSIDNIIDLLGQISTKLPTFVNKCEVVTIILETIPDKLTALDTGARGLLKGKIISMSERVNDILSKKSKGDKIFTTRRRKGPDNEMENIPPPNHYRELSICPTHDDIHMEGKAYVRANKVAGKYDDHNHYLDVQFRLLREDYMRPLREGIKEYLQNVKAGNPKAKLSDMRMYSDVRIVCPKCTRDGIAYRIQFDTTPFKRFRWDASKRLIFGSLVCLSHDNFDTLLFAVVTQREKRDLQQGFVDIRFTENFDMCGDEIKKVFIMLETTAYFEAYRHVLAGLQEFRDKVPFQRYIVSCETEVRPPRYLISQSPPKYDLSCCLNEDVSSSERQRAETIPVLTTSRWPSRSDLCFDDSQLDAVKTALTKEFAIIQGPPGTGKTYVGLKIVRALLVNRAAWGADNPILVVCYTNHALDQFLEGMLDFCDKGGLIRVGGRSNSECLQQHTLKNRKLEVKKNKLTPRYIFDGTRDCWREMKNIEERILYDSVKLEHSANGLLNEKAVRSFMTEEQFECFKVETSTVFQRRQQFNSMSVWLNLGSETYGQPGDGFGESDLHSLSPNHIMAFAYKLQMEKESVETVGYYEQMAETLEHNLKYGSGNIGHNWRMYRQWIWRFQEIQNTKLTKIKQKLKSIQTTNELQEQEEGATTRNIKKNSKEVRHLREDLEGIQETLEQLNNGIFCTSCIKTVLTTEESRELEQLGDQMDEYFIARWLGYTEVVQALVNIQESKNEETDSEDIDFIDVEDEATTITNHRLLDDDEEASSPSKTQIELHDEAQKRAVKELAVCLYVTKRRPIQNGGWQIVGPSKKKLKQKVKKIVCTGEKMTEDEVTCIGNVWDMNVEDRHRLYRYWLDLYRTRLFGQIERFVENYEIVTKYLRAVKDDEDFQILKTAKIIGMTTTGAARYRSILKRVKPKIIVVEEAAEVLESHVISSLNSSCQHLILIGDHKQLRPSPAVYDLAKRYKLDLSLFERMVNNKVRCDTLQLQHRMRPEISEILTFIYSELKNHPSVEGFEHVNGVSSDVFFLHHENLEAAVEDTRSHTNHHEALFTAALCRYLLLQGYEPSQITVLTTYTGQVNEIKKTMPRKIYDGVRVTVVDNYQGEENDIIILSLVRSNTVGSIGFLKVDNRVCVALSRAKKGLFVIGNFKLLADQSPLWSKIVLLLKSKGLCGPVLELYCQNHPATERLKVSTDKDFEAAPEGGCLRPCEARLDCGHQCEMPCHVLDSDHTEYNCQKKCAKQCRDGHNCRKPCYQPCGECEVLVSKLLPQCHHEQNVPCHQDPLTFECQKKCVKQCTDGHNCRKPCYQPCGDCDVLVSKLLPQCHHEQNVPCHQDPLTFECQKKCVKLCTDGHSCRKPCYQPCGDCDVLVAKLLPQCHHEQIIPCHQDPLTFQCPEKCVKKCTDGHSCKKPCYQPCGDCDVLVSKLLPQCHHEQNVPCHQDPLTFKCQKKCVKLCTDGHSCKKPCYQPCGDCDVLVSKLLPQCHHEQIIPCHQDPLTFKCQADCLEFLSCGHRCTEKCSEEHTTKCQVPVTRMWPCTHPVKTACCHYPEEIPCPVKCIETLECGHQCGGTCGACTQGKFHQACIEKCGRILVCGHECLQPCTKTCPPCSDICDNRCTHGKCEKKCGEKCRLCTEPCQWQCEHFKCTEVCGNMCNRPPCHHSCGKSLPCGHKCIGLCGEPCPGLCLVCDKKEVCEIVFGEEDTEGARFILLDDCGHVLEVKAMDHWMSPESSEDDRIQMKACPKCKMAIRTSLRYGNHIKKTLQDMEKVKLKIQGNQNTTEWEKYRLKGILGRSGFDFDTKLKLTELLDTDLSQHQLDVIDNQVILLLSTKKLEDTIAEQMSQLKTEDVLDLMKDIAFVEKLVKNLQNFVTDQELMQFKFEILRISFLFKLLLFQKKLRKVIFPHFKIDTHKELTEDLNAALIDLRWSQALTAEKQSSVRCLVDQLEEIVPLGISDCEIDLVVQDMDMMQGDWFKCPNGHVYNMEDDCGVKESKCPECEDELEDIQDRQMN